MQHFNQGDPMSEFIPTPGRIVEYTITEQDAETIKKRRAATAVDGIHPGNAPSAGETYPMVIVRVWSKDTGCSNGQVLLDGYDTHWVTSVVPGDGERQFRPFPRV
jgi:hypothetical protein